jgi:hypothetical protein
VDRYGDQATVLVHEGAVYGSTSDEDMVGQVMGLLAGLALAPRGPTLQRVGIVGFGTGVSAGAALAAGARLVDVFEAHGVTVATGEALVDVSGLRYQRGRPLHPALRVVSPQMAANERFLRYDVLLSPPETTVLAGVPALISAERLHSLSALLGSGGILVHHLPAFDMQPEHYRRLLRTFADVFEHVMLVAARPHSGDTFVVASAIPLRFQVDHLQRLSRLPLLEPLLERAGIDQAMDIPARVVLSSREQVMALTAGALPVTERAPLAFDERPRRPAVAAPDATAAQREATERALAEYRSHFERMELLRAQLFAIDWPHGQLCPDGPGTAGCLLAHLPQSEAGAETLGQLALALMAVGRFVEAQVTVQSSQAVVPMAAPLPAAQVLTLLLERPARMETVEALPVAVPPLQEVQAALRQNDCATAMSRLEDWTPPASGNVTARVVGAYGLVLCQPESLPAMTRADEWLAPLMADGGESPEPPAVLFLAARAAMVLGQYGKATRWMAQYVARAQPTEVTSP